MGSDLWRSFFWALLLKNCKANQIIQSFVSDAWSSTDWISRRPWNTAGKSGRTCCWSSSPIKSPMMAPSPLLTGMEQSCCKIMIFDPKIFSSWSSFDLSSLSGDIIWSDLDLILIWVLQFCLGKKITKIFCPWSDHRLPALDLNLRSHFLWSKQLWYGAKGGKG